MPTPSKTALSPSGATHGPERPDARFDDATPLRARLDAFKREDRLARVIRDLDLAVADLMVCVKESKRIEDARQIAVVVRTAVASLEAVAGAADEQAVRLGGTE